jgi:PhoPQ-activated pathogenicity-related protein
MPQHNEALLSARTLERWTITDHPSLGQRVTWTSNGVTKIGTIVEAMVKPKKGDAHNWENILGHAKRKYQDTHSIQFTEYSYRGAPISFLVEVRDPNHPTRKPRLLHPYVHKLQPVEE